MRQAISRPAPCIIEIGCELITAKAKAGHGSWLPWLNDEFGWTDDTALNVNRKTVLDGRAVLASSDAGLIEAVESAPLKGRHVATFCRFASTRPSRQFQTRSGGDCL